MRGLKFPTRRLCDEVEQLARSPANDLTLARVESLLAYLDHEIRDYMMFGDQPSTDHLALYEELLQMRRKILAGKR